MLPVTDQEMLSTLRSRGRPRVKVLSGVDANADSNHVEVVFIMWQYSRASYRE